MPAGCNAYRLDTVIFSKAEGETCSFEDGVTAQEFCIGRDPVSNFTAPYTGLELFVAVDPTTSDIYYSDSYQNCVYRISAATGRVRRVGGLLAAYGEAPDGVDALQNPFGQVLGVTVYNGRVYVSDWQELRCG